MRVMQSFPEGRVTTNPYLLQLVQGLRPHVSITGLSWGRALTGRVDVFHVHWPELLLQARTPGRRRLRRALLRVLLLKWRLQHTAIVRTLHNTQSHEALPSADRALLGRLDRQTSLWIRLTPLTDPPAAALDRLPPAAALPVRTIAHGHYREWFAGAEVRAPVPGRLLNFGLVRPYKGIPDLIAAFSATDDKEADMSLHIVGRASTALLGAEITQAATADPRILVTLGHASDQRLAAEIAEAELVVLPYRDMHNSGAALLALSLNCPILVPSNAVTEALRLEVGAGWVFTYPGAVSAEILAGALTGARRDRAADAPDLSARSWEHVVTEHLAAYRTAIVNAAGR